MTEPDPLKSLLHEWKSPEPGDALDRQVLNAYRASVPPAERQPATWRRLLTARISIPVPVLLAAAAAVLLFFWFRPAPAPSSPPDSPGVVTHLNATGFEPLPNGE